MPGKVLLDTNVIVYAYDGSDLKKQKKAVEVLDRLAGLDAGALSTQVLAEFFRAVTRKIASPLNESQAREQVESFVRAWAVLEVNSLVVLESCRGVVEHKFSYWDSQIWATARLFQIPVILSEDFQSGKTIEGVKFLNPFLNEFDLASLIAVKGGRKLKSI